MDKRGVTTRYIILGILAVIVLIALVMFITKTNKAAKTPYETMIEELKGMDISDMLPSQRKVLIKENPDKIEETIKSAKTSKDYSKSEEELRNLIKTYEENKIILDENDISRYLDVQRALVIVLTNKGDYENAGGEAYNSYKLYNEYGFKWKEKQVRAELELNVKAELYNALLKLNQANTDKAFMFYSTFLNSNDDYLKMLAKIGINDIIYSLTDKAGNLISTGKTKESEKISDKAKELFEKISPQIKSENEFLNDYLRERAEMQYLHSKISPFLLSSGVINFEVGNKEFLLVAYDSGGTFAMTADSWFEKLVYISYFPEFKGSVIYGGYLFVYDFTGKNICKKTIYELENAKAKSTMRFQDPFVSCTDKYSIFIESADKDKFSGAIRYNALAGASAGGYKIG